MAMDWRLSAVLIVAWFAGAVAAGPEWTVDPRDPGPDLPPAGRSLFDHLVGTDPVPFPLESLLATIEARLDPDAYLDRPLKRVLIPLGRSLQREAGAPAFFRFPRAVAAVDGEPAMVQGDAGLLLRDRLYIGYLEKADVLEVVSYNERAARFEFQVVRDYREHGERRITYAPRALCTACHQNAAPIFARPLWDETNANDRIAELLAAENKALYGFPIDQGVDMAYAIDNATDRANGFSLTQRLWREGCGAGEAGRHCRGKLTIAVLQRLLLGRPSAVYDQALVERMRVIRTGRWPEGLLLPDPDIPNRKPLERLAPLDEAAPDVPEAATLFGESSIPSRFEPLAPRAPVATFNPVDTDWVGRAVEGLGEFLARTDVRRLDAHLSGLPASTRVLDAPCRVQADPLGDERERLKLDCRGEALSLRARIFQQANGRLSGRVTSIRIDGEEIGTLVLAGQVRGDRLDLAPSRSDSLLTPRLADGNALVALELTRGGGETTTARVRAVIREDVHALVEAVERLMAHEHAAFDEAPFQRARILPALFRRLGMESLAWCCVEDGHLQPPVTEATRVGTEAAGLRPFYQVCARCHRTYEPFPPNFLAGTPQEVEARVGHCSERIAFRLGMWDLAAEQRPKTPMPPQFVLTALGTTVEDWPQHPTLADLRQALRALRQRQGDPLSTPEELLARDYRTLRPCLPDGPAALDTGARP